MHTCAQLFDNCMHFLGANLTNPGCSIHTLCAAHLDRGCPPLFFRWVGPSSRAWRRRGTPYSRHISTKGCKSRFTVPWRVRISTALRRQIARTIELDAANRDASSQNGQVECSTLHGNGFWKTRLFNLPYPPLAQSGWIALRDLIGSGHYACPI